MELVVRALAIYVLLWAFMRFGGKRSFAEMTTFDFLLLLILAEATQQALVGEDYSVTAALLVIVTLIGIQIGTSLLKQKFKKVEKVMDDIPIILVENGEPLKERLEKERIDEDDIMTAARHQAGLQRMDQIKFAVLERSGGVSIIPKDEER
jgi:uncharacterized membrane protein YcaP (DUF421 family)